MVQYEHDLAKKMKANNAFHHWKISSSSFIVGPSEDSLQPWRRLLASFASLIVRLCYEIQTIVDLSIASAALIYNSNNDAEVPITGSECHDRNAYYRQRLETPVCDIRNSVDKLGTRTPTPSKSAAKAT